MNISKYSWIHNLFFIQIQYIEIYIIEITTIKKEAINFSCKEKKNLTALVKKKFINNRMQKTYVNLNELKKFIK